MNSKQVLVATLIAAASVATFAADDEQQSFTRTDVRSAFLKAGASHQLPRGEIYGGEASQATKGFGLSRAEVNNQFRTARAAGELQPAGEGTAVSHRETSFALAKTRSDVKAEVIAARKAGELLPAGEQYAYGFNGRVVRTATHSLAVAHGKAAQAPSAE